MKKSKKFKIGLALAIIGGLSVIGTFANFDISTLFVSVVIMGIGILLIVLDSNKKPQKPKATEHKTIQAVTAEAEPQKPKQKSKQEIARENAETFHFSVAGVTFKNEDGTSRQATLKKIYKGQEPFEYGANYTLDSYEFEGEDAIHIVADEKYIIGNVPRKDVDFVMSLAGKITDMDVVVYDFENEEEKTIYAVDVTVYYKD